jgi:ribosomal protein L11 methyltransferase
MEFSMKLFQLTCLVPDRDEELFCAFLAENVSWGWETEQAKAGRIRFIIYLENERAARELTGAVKTRCPLAECMVVPFEDRDWSESWKEFFIPVRVLDTFVVVPPWRTDEEHVGGLIPLIIEPKMAFGTGHHATTFLCLEALSRLRETSAITPRSRFLDLGTGSGILALACAKIGLSGLGLDIDPVAVDNALENMRLNTVEGLVEIRRGTLDAVPDGQRFDLVLANILAAPLERMASALVSRLAPGGILVLSGILVDQASRVEKAYQEQGLPAPSRLSREGWAALIWGMSPVTPQEKYETDHGAINRTVVRRS